MTSLNCSPIGKTQKIKWIMGSCEEIENLHKLGMTEGKPVTVLNSFYGNIIVAVENIRYALSEELACCIKVG